jgi:hypothetical protein
MSIPAPLFVLAALLRGAPDELDSFDHLPQDCLCGTGGLQL